MQKQEFGVQYSVAVETARLTRGSLRTHPDGQRKWGTDASSDPSVTFGIQQLCHHFALSRASDYLSTTPNPRQIWLGFAQWFSDVSYSGSPPIIHG